MSTASPRAFIDGPVGEHGDAGDRVRAELVDRPAEAAGGLVTVGPAGEETVVDEAPQRPADA